MQRWSVTPLGVTPGCVAPFCGHFAALPHDADEQSGSTPVASSHETQTAALLFLHMSQLLSAAAATC